MIGMSDCLWGLLDGVNDSGLCVSLTFGGRRDVGDGFAIPLVVRYLLETCDDVAQARAALARIPVHAAQNVTLLDAAGDVVTAYVGPGRPPAVPRHRGDDQPPGQGRLAGVRGRHPLRRARALRARPARRPGARLASGSSAAFLEPPLHSTEYASGFGTLYTAAYFPTERRVEYRWPGVVWEQSFDAFTDSARTVTFAQGRRAA